MPRRSRTTALLSSLLTTTLAASALGASSAQATTGPEVTGTDYRFTARIDIGDGARACSSVLIAPQWLLTSAACFSADALPPTGAPASPTTATFGDLDAAPALKVQRKVVELIPRTDRDVTLARLDKPVTTIAPVPIATGVPAAGSTVTIAGYGRTKDEWSPLKLHTSTFTVGDVDGAELPMTGKDGGAVCAGDSGGPVLATVAGVTKLVALNSRSWQGGCWGSDPNETRTDALSTRVDDIARGNTLVAGAVLGSQDSLVSNAARLTMQANGDLVVVSNAGKTLWSTKTAGHPGATARFSAQGDLTVVDSDGTTVLWHAGVTAPGGKAVLQDRGNFVVYNAAGEAQWGAGTEVRHDYNGDGRSDMAAWYDYSDGHDSLQTLTAAADGTLQQPFQSYASAVGSWNAANMQFSTGDFNGDGRGDMAALYGYSDGSVKLFTALGKADGGFEAPSPSWSAAPGGWTARNMTLHSGDFNGDGRDDLAVWYDYDDGTDRLFTFTATTAGGFNAPFPSWSNTNNDWNRDNMKFVTGDFNGDGRDDIGTLYRFADGSIKMYSFLAKPDGGFQASIGSWGSATFGDWNRTHVNAGDFNGDGRDDVAAWYDYSDGHDAIHILTSSTTLDGQFNTPALAYETAAGNFTYADMRLVPGDYNGDGLDDLAGMYGYSDGKVKMFTWTSRPDGKINGSAPGWASATTTGWDINRSTFLRSAN
ncbi:FG-GAP-like repeat-containing protein [Streptomyces sp. NPDC047024]|uniref:FG-GAP-like repeat-containing protein n=1 Tax=Streptomyces sp. NPDC047024 TaxID=3155476 RepID=UPI0033D5A9BA